MNWVCSDFFSFVLFLISKKKKKNYQILKLNLLYMNTQIYQVILNKEEPQELN